MNEQKVFGERKTITEVCKSGEIISILQLAKFFRFPFLSRDQIYAGDSIRLSTIQWNLSSIMPVASRYTDCTGPAHCEWKYEF
jgi:hypothetical protein